MRGVMDNVESFPNWKSSATAEERFSELVVMARKNPERFKRVVVIYTEEVAAYPGEKNPGFHTRYVTTGCSTTEALGVMALGKEKLLRWVLDSVY